MTEFEESASPGLAQPRLGPGLLLAIPLFLAYEWGVAAAGDTMGRNSAELLLTAALRPLGDHADPARWIALGLLFALVGWRVLAQAGEGEEEGVEDHDEYEDDEEEAVPADRSRHPGLILLRTVGQGLLFAVLLGPVLIGLMSILDISPLAGTGGPAGPPPNPGLAQVARLSGAAVWEELLFRVGIYSVFYLFVVRLAGFFSAAGTGWHLLADLVAILGSSLVFAAFHLQSFTRPLGVGGEPFDPAVFLWRLLAGILLAGLYRWKGLGVVAWTHGLFNLALFLGADPLVFRASP